MTKETALALRKQITAYKGSEFGVSDFLRLARKCTNKPIYHKQEFDTLQQFIIDDFMFANDFKDGKLTYNSVSKRTETPLKNGYVLV